MNSIMGELRQNVTTAENNLRAIALQQISDKKEDDPEYQTTMKNISIVKQIREILGSCEIPTPEEPKQEEMLTMNSDLRNKKIAFMTIDSNTYNIKSLKDIATGISDHLLKNNYQSLLSNETEFKTSNTGKMFASTKRDNIECENPTEIKHGRKSFYIDTNRVLANNMNLLKKMTVASGLNLNEVKFSTV